MYKYKGIEGDFSLVRDDGSRLAICYEIIPCEDSIHYEWYEVYFYPKKDGVPTFKRVKEAIQKDINNQTDEKILTGFVWNNINVYLSNENQRNFSEAQRMAEANPAILPVTFKLGEDSDDAPIYHTFESVEELNGFYLSAFSYINQCLNEGWQRKDSIDWEPYKEYFPEPEELVTE